MKVECYSGGDDFWQQKHEKGEYIMIICDLVLSDTNGILLARKIRKYDGAVPVIFCKQDEQSCNGNL